MVNNILKIIIAGEGGQGVQTIGKILAQAAFQKNLKALYLPNFGVEQRGGVSVAFVQIGKENLYYPKFSKADLLVLLSKRSTERTKRYADNQSRIIYNSSEVTKELLPNAKSLIPIDAKKIASEEFTPQVLNIIILGALIPLIPFLEEKGIKQAIKKQLGHKFKQKPEMEALNYKAFDRGVRLIKKDKDEN